jgi:hypothetical protein
VPAWRATRTIWAPDARAALASARILAVSMTSTAHLLVGRKLETVEPVGVGEQRHLDAVRVEHRRAGLLLGAAVAASVLETGGVHGVEGPLDAVDALVDGVVRRGRARIEAGVDEGGEDLLRHREDRIARVGTARRCDRRLQVADGQVGALDERFRTRQQRPVVQAVACFGRVGRGVLAGLVGDAGVQEDVAGEGDGHGRPAA